MLVFALFKIFENVTSSRCVGSRAEATFTNGSGQAQYDSSRCVKDWITLTSAPNYGIEKVDHFEKVKKINKREL